MLKRHRSFRLSFMIALTVTVGILSVILPGYAGLAENTTYACANPPGGLIAWYPGNNDARDIAFANNGQIAKGTTFGYGVVGQAFQFDGVDGHVEAPDSLTLGSIGQEITVDAWINPISGGWIFGRREPFSWDSFDVWVDNRLLAGVGTDQADSALATQPGLIQFGKWQHIAVTASTVTGEVWGYVNGVRYPMTVVDGTPVIAGVFRKAHVLIGQRQSPYTMECEGAAAYKGRVDELHIFNRALTPEEIHAIYVAGKSGLCKFCVAH
jgi:hypothetical protein